MQKINGFIYLLSILVCQTAAASGNVQCQGEGLTVSWGTSHMTGSPRYGNPLTIEIGKEKEEIPDKQIVGYYVHANVVLILALDREMNKQVLDLRVNLNTRKPSFLTYKEKMYSLSECVFE